MKNIGIGIILLIGGFGVILISMLAFVFGATVPLASQEERIGSAVNGRIVYEDFCTGCHQADGKGMNGMLGADFTDKERMKKSNDELLKSIKFGFKGKNGVMPPWEGTLSDKQMKDVLQYIRDAF